MPLTSRHEITGTRKRPLSTRSPSKERPEIFYLNWQNPSRFFPRHKGLMKQVTSNNRIGTAPHKCIHPTKNNYLQGKLLSLPHKNIYTPKIIFRGNYCLCPSYGSVGCLYSLLNPIIVLGCVNTFLPRMTRRPQQRLRVRKGQSNAEALKGKSLAGNITHARCQSMDGRASQIFFFENKKKKKSSAPTLSQHPGKNSVMEYFSKSDITFNFYFL